MKIHECAQGSVEWLQARSAIPTASEFGNLVTAKIEPRKWSTEMPNTYLARKLAEKWLGGPLPGFGAFATEQGEILEGEALPFLEFQFNWKIARVGLITTDDGRIGCSPDGLLESDSGLEVKCPSPEVHIKYLLNNELPEAYGPQVYGAMLVTGRASWTFCSYRRRMPPLILHIAEDAAAQERLRDALDDFLERFDAGWLRLCELNGGPPPVRPPDIRFSERNDRVFETDVPIP